MAPAISTPPTADERRDTLVERLFMATVGAMDVLGVYIGDRLGLYRTLAERRPSTSQELAGALGLSERYVREWLEQQAASGSSSSTPARGTARSGATRCRQATTRRCSTRPA
jgi:hypothetical protein